MDFGLVAAAVLAGAAVALGAQSPTSTFDVASIKRSVSKSFPVGPEARPGGVFFSTNVTLSSLVRFAYDVPDYRLTGGPDWVRTARFDIEARAGRNVSSDELKRMVQSLLQERFQLAVRREQREMPIYTLVLARNNKQVGPNLRQSAAECALPGGPGETMRERVAPDGGVRTIRTCTSMAALVSSLSNALQSPVSDRTTLSGLWDYELSFTGDRRRNARTAIAEPNPGEAPILFTAVQEQLGLRLERGRGPVDVLVIESAAQPAQN